MSTVSIVVKIASKTSYLETWKEPPEKPRHDSKWLLGKEKGKKWS